MPKVFDQELGALKQAVLTMGETAEQMIRDSMKALVDRDEKLIAEVQQKEEVTDRLQVAIDDHVVRLIVTHAPVAQDLRFLLMVARINTELERVGDQAVEIIREDDQVDALNDQIFRDLLTYMMSDPKNIPRALALILTARSLERIADHATNICEEVVYLVKGQDIRHQSRQSTVDS